MYLLGVDDVACWAIRGFPSIIIILRSYSYLQDFTFFSDDLSSQVSDPIIPN